MAIYISGVKGLPEQVQENKENIKTIQEEIEGIDFDAIRELEEQVAENTQDINNMEGTIGTQNIAITNLSGRADTLEGKVATLENKTQEITYDDVNNATNIQDVKMQDAEAHTLSITADNYGITNNVMLSKDNKGAIVLATASNPTISLINTASGTTHSLDFNADGSVEVDGQPIGKSYYEHNVCLSYDSGSNGHTHIFIQIESEDPTPFTKDTLRAYLKNAGFTSATKSHLANGFYDSLSTAYHVFGLYSNNGTDLQAIGYSALQPNMSYTNFTISNTFMGTLTDFVL